MSESPYQLAEAGEQDIAASMELARLRYRQGDLEAAQELCHRIMERDPTNPEVYYQLGVIALQREAREMAYHYFCLAADLDPDGISPLASAADKHRLRSASSKFPEVQGGQE